MAPTNWPQALKPLLDKYRGQPHPLEFKNLYQLLVMVVLSARDSDKNINNKAPEFFRQFPTLKDLSLASEPEIFAALKKVRGGKVKGGWLMKIAQQIKSDQQIPLTMETLTALPGIGRKSANVIMRGAGVKAEGVMVDLHVVRVAPRLGIAKSQDPKKIEEQIMAVMPREDWGEIGMSLSFLGRETCRPSHPHHHECVVSKHCAYFQLQNGKTNKTAAGPATKKSTAKASTPAQKKPLKKEAKSTAKKRPAKKPALKKKTKKN